MAHEVSAGGLVVNEIYDPNKVQLAALIGRVDKRSRTLWSLPKGHIELGETSEQAAIREVAEETGILGDILAELGSINYWFASENCYIHKTVHHYLMKFRGGELSNDDVEVNKTVWIPLRDLPSKLTYADERKLANIASIIIKNLNNHGPESLAPLSRKALHHNYFKKN